MLVGAYGTTSGGNAGAGVAYVYDLTNLNSISSAQTLITASDGAANDNFGYSVAVSGTLAVVGATGKTVSGLSAAGKVYAFDVTDPASPTAWTTNIPDPAPIAGAYFGSAVALSGKQAVIGASG